MDIDVDDVWDDVENPRKYKKTKLFLFQIFRSGNVKTFEEKENSEEKIKREFCLV